MSESDPIPPVIPQTGEHSGQRQRPILSVYTSSSPDAERSRIEVDGKVKSTHGRVLAVYDHHRSGERINLDAVPGLVDESMLAMTDELAASGLDTDFVVSAVVVRMGGKDKVNERDLRILEAASEWCDLLVSDETDQLIKDAGLSLHFHMKNRGFSRMKELCEQKGELNPLNSRPTPSDETMTQIANELADELEKSIRGDRLEEGMQAQDYLAKKDSTCESWTERNVRNDELLALTIAEKGEYFDPLFITELVKGKLRIDAVRQGPDEDGRELFHYVIGLVPAFNEELDLRLLIEKMNEADPVVQIQIQQGIEEANFRGWGGRSVAFGSPHGIRSALRPEEVAQIIEENIHLCKK
ncbi:hypothetical protein HN709_03065 [Candidatus Peregrinibacteria bacterium]|nr:hypothetical protein [Candidatus Peregrinibacteria bacterium]